jgi:multiple sugar transport system permease protein
MVTSSLPRSTAAPSSPILAGQLRRRQRKDRIAYLFVAPAIAILALMLVIPALSTIGFSVTDISFLSPAHYVGLSNYRSLLHDPSFRQAIVNTAYYTVGTTVPSMALGLLAAVALNGRFRGRGVLRTLFYLPVLTSVVAAAVVWLYVYDPQQGLLNGLLTQVGLPRPQWLASATLAMPSLIIMGVWRDFGSAMLLYLAGLQGIPGHVYEAARIDGAGRWRTLTRITIPLLNPVTYYLVIISIVGSFQVFGPIYVMTQGGPVGSTTTAVYLMYQNAFSYTKVGYASAMSTILFAVILAFSIVGSRFLRQEER